MSFNISPNISPQNWNDRAESFQGTRILQHGNDMLLPYTAPAVASLRAYCTPSNRIQELFVVQIVENQLGSEKCRTLTPMTMSGQELRVSFRGVQSCKRAQSRTYLAEAVAESGQSKTISSIPCVITVFSAAFSPSLLRPCGKGC